MNNHFRIDYRKFVALMLPTLLRKPIVLSVMRVLVEPLVSLNDKRVAMRSATLFGLHHTGQVCYIKDALNSYFGFTYANGFEISDINSEGEFVFAFDETEHLSDRHWIVEDAPAHTMLYDEELINVPTKSFFVFVPRVVWSNADKMAVVRRLVERYRLVSRLPEYKLKRI